MNLINKIRNMPQSSGIYQYFDKDSKILYIGKAKNLHKRVKSYFSIKEDSLYPSSNLSPRIANMVAKIHSIKIIVVDSEQDALILENSLIKQLKPRYNILLRDDKTYPYIVIDKSADFPRLEVSRKVVNNHDLLYYGPYSAGIKEIIDSIYEIIPLVQKKSCIKSKEACLFYQIKRCLAPCINNINKQEYREILHQAITLLENPQKLIFALTQKMNACAKNLRFEEANTLKHRIQKIKDNTKGGIIDLAKLYNLDIFALSSAQKTSVIVKICMRDGKVVLSDHYFIHHNDNEADENYLYTQALISHYKHNPPHKLDSILLPISLDSHKEIEDFLKTHYGRKIRITQTKNGDKARLIELALKNAKHLLQENQDACELESLQCLLNLENLPCRIEVFDTSHHGGSGIVGGMIVFENGAFKKDSYRRYNLQGSDEYAQMTEMLTRRAKDFEASPPPDLWLLDGGMGQINIAWDIIASCGANVDVAAIAKEKIDSKAHRAKGGAWDIIRTKHKEMKLNKNDKRLMFLQSLRDEAHRYAISFHRHKARKTLQNSTYTPAQTQKLLAFFGSFEALHNADEKLIKKILKAK